MAEEKTNPTIPTPVPPDLKALLAQDQKNRSTKCEAEINEVLKKYDCTLVTFQQFTNGQPGNMMVQVTPNVPK